MGFLVISAVFKCSALLCGFLRSWHPSLYHELSVLDSSNEKHIYVLVQPGLQSTVLPLGLPGAAR